MDVVTRGLDLTERSDLDAVGDLEHIVDDEKRDKNGFQKENVYNRLLPYDITTECGEHLMRIKTSLAKCIQLDQETVYEWFIDLERYVDLYGLAFTREDHIYFVKLQFGLMVSKNSMDLYYIAYVARCFIRLMDKRFLISSEELELDWRQLYDTYERLLYSSTESIGLRFVPENLESNLSQAIRLSRPHFSIESTQQMLDEWRPMLCPSSVAFQKAVTYMYLFLPTTLPPEHHDKGFKLWFDEVMQMWLSGKVGVAYESKFTLLLSRLSSDCMGFIDWEPYIPRIFNHFKTSLNLNGGVSRPHMRRTHDSIDVGPCVVWIIYMINAEGSCFDHISKLFKAIESFYHPSNTDRRWHCKLQQFLYKLPAYYVKRLHRERFKNTVWNRRLTESCKLTEEQTTKFVDALLPVVLTSMFNQAGVRSASMAFRDLSVLRPERVIPPLLDRLYGSYETLTEPHRLLASILCMASVIPAMVRPCKFFPQGPSHVVPLLLNSLPGIDSNDMRKCIAVFRFIATLASHIRMKDYSYLVEEKPELTYEQQQLCLSTGQFEDFVIQFLDKCFILIENTATATFSNLDQESHSKNGEEGMIEAAISSVTLSILAQASEEIQRSAVDKIYYHVKSHIFDTKTQGKAIATLCLACAKLSPQLTLSKFLPHFGRLIQSLTDNDEVFQESILDDELLFALLLTSEIVRCNSLHLLDHKDLIVDVLQRALKLTAKEGYMLGCNILRHLLRGLTDITCCDWRNIDYGDENNQATEEKWPFDNWGHTTRIKDLKLRWEIPGPEAREFARELLEIFLRRAVDDLLLWSDGKRQLTREQVQRSLLIILSSLVGAAPVLPSIKGKVINLCPFEVPVVPMCVGNTGTDPLNFADGTDIRTWIVESMKKVLVHIKSTSDDDTKSLVLVCEIFATSISYYGYNKTEIRLAADRIKSMKSATQNKLLSSKRESRYLLVERVRQQHRAMLLNKGRPDFTELHMDVFKSLFTLAQSHYVEVRIIAQDTIYMILNHFPFSETVLVPLLVDELGKKEIEHNKFKGLLYLVIGRRSYTSVAIDPNWSFLRKLWPALVESPHSEKPSIVKLFDRICSLVQKSFDTFELRYNFGEDIKQIASQVWSSGTIDLNIYQPPEQQSIDHIRREVMNRNKQRVNDYEQLILKLVELIDNPHLHWHRRIVAYSFFTHLMRDDHPLPLPALQLCLSCLISERLSVRTKAVQLVTAQLKLHKRKHIKRKIYRASSQSSEPISQLEAKAKQISLNESEEAKNQQEGQNLDDNAMPKQSEQQPDDCNLLGNSNKWMQYKLSSGSYSEQEWDKMVLVDKPHIGFYVWPKVLQVYEPYAKQPQLNRPIEELNDFELAVYKNFTDPEFVEKLVNYFCFEDKNNQDNVRFNINRPNLFKGIFRNFGPCMIEPFRKYVVEYATSTCEQKQKFVIEFLAGLLRGSKHWSYSMLNELRELSISIIDQITITQENINDWTGLSNYVFRHRDARRYQWLLDHFVTKATSQVESTSPTTTPFIQASRLTLAHYTLIQCEWRAVDHIFPIVIKNLRPQDHLLAYANIRNCLASIYSLIYMFDDSTTITKIPTTLADCPKRDEFIESLLPKLAILERGKQSNSHLVVTPGNIKSTLHQDSLHNDQAESSAHLGAVGVEMVGKLMADGLESRYASKIQAAGAAATNVATIASLPMDPETTDESDMELIAETLMKFRQLETNPKSPSALGHLRHQHHLEHHHQQRSHKHHLDQSNEAKVDSKTRPVVSSGNDVASFEDNLANLNVADSAAVVAAAVAGSGADDSQERKDAIKLMRLTSCWIIYLICRMKSPVPAEFFKLLPVICETGRESSDPELAADSLAAVAILGSSTLSPGAIVESLKCVRKIIAERSWHARVAAAAFIEIMISSNLFKLLSNEQWRNEIEDIVINHLICDERIEVRESSSLTLSGMIHCEFTKLTPELLDEFKRRANEPLVKRKQPNGIIVIDPKKTVTRHSGIICLCACVDANPYTVPDYLPSILTLLSDHLTDPQPISTTIKKTMSNFRRTHHDNWQSDKTKFTDDQLCILADLLVSPSYYA